MNANRDDEIGDGDDDGVGEIRSVSARRRPSASAGSRGHREDVDKIGAFSAICAISGVGIAIGLSYPLLSFTLEERGFSSSVIGANAAISGIASIIAVPAVNPIARRIGPANTLLFAAILSAASLIGFYALASIEAWFALRIAFHGAITASFVVSEYWINSSVPERKRGFMLGIYATLLALGFSAGPIILIAAGTKGAAPFLIGAAVLACSAIPPLLARARQPLIPAKAKAPALLKCMKIAPLAMGAVFAFGAAEEAFFALFPVYGIRTGHSETGINLMLVCLGLGNVAWQIPLGALSDRVADRRKILMFCACAGAAGAALLPFLMQDLRAAGIGFFIWGGLTAGMYTIGLAHLGSKMKGAGLAQANAAFILCYSLGTTAGPQLAGSAMDWIGNNGFALAIGLPFALWAVAGAIGIKNHPRIRA